MKYEFEGKVALITGAGSGIGKAVALELAAQRAYVVAADLNGDTLKKIVDKITEAGGKAIAFEGDVAKPKDVKASVDLAVKTFGGLHLAFNNAGVSGPKGPIEDISVDDYLRLIDINLHSVFYGMQSEIPAMMASGADQLSTPPPSLAL